MDLFKNLLTRSKSNSVLVNDYKFIDIIGQGSFGTVIETVNKNNNGKRAIKIIDGDDIDSDREVTSLKVKNIDCAYIVKYYSSWKEDISDLSGLWKSRLMGMGRKLPERFIAIELELCSGIDF